MEFGHIEENINDIDFTLSSDAGRNKRVLATAGTTGELEVYVGGSKWGEKTWVGKIYPPRTKDNAFLPFYAKSFNTVECGATFYHVVGPEQVAKWVSDVSDRPDFKFCPRFSQQITHIRKLTNVAEQTANFYQSLAGFGNHLGPVLLLLGDTFSPKLLPQLKAYLSTLPPSPKVFVEARHKAWYAEPSNRAELFQLLEDHHIATVISDTPGRRDVVHMELTTNEVMIRFGGNNLAPSDYTRLDAWVNRLKVWKDQGLQKVWFFMHQYDERYAPEACDYFIKKLNENLGTNIARPRLLTGNSNLLF
jgi:uncharacterized protein YecE (DUF72 family)